VTYGTAQHTVCVGHGYIRHVCARVWASRSFADQQLAHRCETNCDASTRLTWAVEGRNAMERYAAATSAATAHVPRALTPSHRRDPRGELSEGPVTLLRRRPPA
jgi:hypothetical protein